MEGDGLQWALLGVVPALILVSILLNYSRARRWNDKIRSHGSVSCRSCGFVGELLVRTISAAEHSSSNLRLVCQKCNSSDWFVPDNDQAR